jgi:hypothetical protein
MEVPNVQSITNHVHVVQRKGKEMLTYNGKTKVNDTFYVSNINKDFLFVEAIINKKMCVMIFGSQKCWIVMQQVCHSKCL